MNKRTLAVLSAAVGLLSLSALHRPASAAASHLNWAMSIGVADYESPIASLEYAERDAVAFADALVRSGDFRRDQVRVGVREGGDFEPSPNQVIRQLNAMVKSLEPKPGEGPKAENVVFFFSGHGTSELNHAGNKVNYMVFADTLLEDLPTTALTVQRVVQYLERTKAPRRVLIIDACRDQLLDDAAAKKGLLREDGTFADSGLTLATGTVILWSAEFGSPSYEDDERQHGAFTAALLDGLAGAADPNADGIVTVEEMLTYTQQDLARRAARTGQIQIPFRGGEATGGAFPLVHRTVPPDEPEAALSLVHFTVEPTRVEPGQSALATWKASDPDAKCHLSPPGIDMPSESAAQLHPLERTTYSLRCTHEDQLVEERVVLEVDFPTATIEAFSANPATIRQRDEEVRLEWSSADAKQCTLSGEGDVPASGTRYVEPGGDARWTLTCYGPGGEDTATTAVSYAPPDVYVDSFTSDDSRIEEGESTRLRWESSGAETCELDGETVPTSGSKRVRPDRTTEYTLECSNSADDDADWVEVEVAPSSEEPAYQCNLFNQAAVIDQVGNVLRGDELVGVVKPPLDPASCLFDLANNQERYCVDASLKIWMLTPLGPQRVGYCWE